MKRFILSTFLILSIQAVAAPKTSVKQTPSEQVKEPAPKTAEPIVVPIKTLPRVPLQSDCENDKCILVFGKVHSALASNFHLLKAAINPACTKLKELNIKPDDARLQIIQQVLTEDCPVASYVDPYIQTSVDAFSARVQHLQDALKLASDIEIETGNISTSSDHSLGIKDHLLYIITTKESYLERIKKYETNGYFTLK